MAGSETDGGESICIVSLENKWSPLVCMKLAICYDFTMLMQPLSSSEEKYCRKKLTDWHPDDQRQNQRLELIQSFLQSGNVSAETVCVFRALYDFLLSQSAAVQEIDAVAIAEGRKDIRLSPSHPLVTMAFQKSGPADDLASKVDHLRESDLQKRAEHLEEILKNAEEAITREKIA